MKKTFLLTCLAAGLLTRSALATITFSAAPSSQTVAAGGSFNVSFTLSVTQASAPANVSGFDLYLATAAGNTGRFAITAAASTGAFNSLGPTEPTSGDVLSTAAATNFVRNGVDQGFIGSAQTTPLTAFPLEQLTLSVASGTPAGTYTFSTTTAANAGVYYSDVSDSQGNIYQADTPGTFSITVTAVPEPSTWALLVGGAGLAAGALRTRRTRAAERMA